jgi:uncharacterized protein YcbX
MKVVGRVQSLWRYPVKSMRGEKLEQAFVGFAGVYGDRVYAFRSSAARAGFPYLTGREQPQMLLYKAVFRHPDVMAQPSNLAAAEALGSGLTPVYPGAAERMVDVETPAGDVFAIDDPRLIQQLNSGLAERHELSLLQSDRAMTDCRPISLFSVHTAKQLGDELGFAVDPRRFRANIYAELESGAGFGEDEFVNRTLQIGDRACITILARDTRCKMITLDSDTAEAKPEIMRVVAGSHESKAGVYGAVLVEGTIRTGDQIVLTA